MIAGGILEHSTDLVSSDQVDLTADPVVLTGSTTGDDMLKAHGQCRCNHVVSTKCGFNPVLLITSNVVLLVDQIMWNVCLMCAQII